MRWRKKIGIFPWHKNQSMKLLSSGKPFFEELLFQIQNSQKEIHLQVYIFEADHTGKIIFEALLEAAKRKVKIAIWLDAYGSSNFPKSWENELINRGVELNYFSRFKFAFRYHIGMRLHHKIFIFDREVALLGGINISDHYSHLGNKKTWLDFGIKIKGNVVYDLLKICLSIENGFRPMKSIEKSALTYQEDNGHIKARVLQNHWSKAKFAISRQYRQRIRRAQKEITIIASYFIPSPALKRLLKKAATRGVKVKLILGELSDLNSIKYASHFFYSDLLKAGVEIWEWQPSILHAKLAFIDEDWMCIGSYNLNHLSDFGSVECNLEIHDKAFQEASLAEVNNLLESNAKMINALDYQKKIGWFSLLRNFISYRLVTLSMKLLFYLQRE